MAEASRFEVRVYYEDTDFSGNVYHAAYLKFCERARTEFLRAHGVHHFELAKDGLAFAVRSMTIEFEAPAHIDDLLVVETRPLEASGARLRLEQIVWRGAERLVAVELVVVAIRGDRPVRLPDGLRAAVPQGEARRLMAAMHPNQLPARRRDGNKARRKSCARAGEEALY